MPIHHYLYCYQGRQLKYWALLRHKMILGPPNLSSGTLSVPRPYNPPNSPPLGRAPGNCPSLSCWDPSSRARVKMNFIITVSTLGLFTFQLKGPRREVKWDKICWEWNKEFWDIKLNFNWTEKKWIAVS